MTRTDIINMLIGTRGYASYLEIGVDNPANNYGQIKCAHKECVDPYDPALKICSAWDETSAPTFVDYVTYHMTSDKFFEKFPDKRYDLIFIDGLHLEHQSDKDIVNALRHLNPGGAVVVHDCLPPDEPSQSEIDPAGSWSGTVWRSVIKCSLQTKLDITIVDTDWGVGIIEYTDQPIFSLPATLDMDYRYFAAHNWELLHIVSPAEWLNQ